MASVRQGWKRNNGYLVKAGYPLFLPSRKALEQFSPSHAIYSRGLNTEVIGGDADGQADRPKLVMKTELVEWLESHTNRNS